MCMKLNSTSFHFMAKSRPGFIRKVLITRSFYPAVSFQYEILTRGARGLVNRNRYFLREAARAEPEGSIV